MNYELLKWDPCKLRERCKKGVFRAAHSMYPLGQCPPVPDKGSVDSRPITGSRVVSEIPESRKYTGQEIPGNTLQEIHVRDRPFKI